LAGVSRIDLNGRTLQRTRQEPGHRNRCQSTRSRSTDFPGKHGGLAAQQADVAAQSIAAQSIAAQSIAAQSIAAQSIAVHSIAAQAGAAVGLAHR
jgi:hypothetical protein